MVWPNSSTDRRSSVSTSAPERESRLPVGSSAKTIEPAGWPARAPRRPAAAGRRRARWGGGRAGRRSPTVSITVSYHSGSGLRPAIDSGSRMFSSAVSVGHEVERLEDEADLVAAEPGELLVLEPRQLGVADEDRAAGGAVERRAAVHQRRLARARRAHHGGELAGVQLQRHLVEGDDAWPARCRRSWSGPAPAAAARGAVVCSVTSGSSLRSRRPRSGPPPPYRQTYA